MAVFGLMVKHKNLQRPHLVCTDFGNIFVVIMLSFFFTECIRLINTLRPRQNGLHFADDIFKRIFMHQKMYEFRLRIHWNLFLRFQLTIFQYWFRNWLGADQATSHYLNQWWLVYWRIYASLGLNELRFSQVVGMAITVDFFTRIAHKNAQLTCSTASMFRLVQWIL